VSVLPDPRAITSDEREADDDSGPDAGTSGSRASAAMRLRPALTGDDGPLAASLLASLFPGQVPRPRLGRYALLNFLGEGGMGSVYAAYDERLDRRVAVKFLRAAADDAHAQARLLREAMAMARLSHPNIVTVHEVWEEDGRVHVAMEYVQGEDLASWQREPRSWRELVEAYRQAGEGLAAAHAARLVHRDFKPQNAIRRADGTVKVLDFGLARIGGTIEPALPSPGRDRGVVDDLTRTGTIMGTPMYMAPEQLEGAPADARSDQFSFCVALWEGLYGRPPFPAGSLAPREEPRPGRSVPAHIRRVLDRGLQRDPQARHPSMRALLRDLARDPALVRRRVVIALTGAALTIGGGLAIAELRAPERCVAADDEAAALWGGSRREAVLAGIQRAGVATADETWALLRPRLDTYAAGLVAGGRAACETHRRGLHSDQLYDRRVACLDRQRASFTRLTDLLGAGDHDAALHAMTAVTSLPSPSTCGDLEALSVELPPPDDPQVAERVAALRRELARAHTEESAGKYAEAEARAVAVQREAEAMGYPPLQAEAALRRGSTALQRGSPEALAWLDMALWTGLRVDHRSVAAEAAATRIFARLELGDRTADVSEALALARPLVDRTGASEWRIRWLFANNAAIAHERRGQLTPALQAYREALALVPDDGASFERAATLQNMAPLQVRLGAGAAARHAARAAVADLRALFGPTHPQTASAEAVSATVLRALGHLAEAAELLAGAIPRAAADTGAPPLWMLHEAARVDLLRGDLAGVRGWCERARPQLTTPDGTHTPWHLAFAALAARAGARAGDVEALAHLDAVDAVVRAGNAGFVALARAESMRLLGRHAEAEATLRVLLAKGASEADDREARLLLARVLVARDAHEEAARWLAPLLAEGPAASSLEPGERALVLQVLAAVETAAGRHDPAVAHAREALHALDGFDDPSPALAEAWFTLARTLAAADAPSQEARDFGQRVLAAYMSFGPGGEGSAAEVRRWLERAAATDK